MFRSNVLQSENLNQQDLWLQPHSFKDTLSWITDLTIYLVALRATGFIWINEHKPAKHVCSLVIYMDIYYIGNI